MAVELGEIAAGLPMAASLALAGGITTLREGRRRAALNEAMHELRRPLQVLSLALPDRLPGDAAVDSSLRLVTDALDRLDRRINGDAAAVAAVRVSPRPLLEEAVLRWSSQAAAAGGGLALHWKAGEAIVAVDPAEFAQAVDNLISNAIEHGGGRVTVEARRVGFLLLVSVRDSGPRSGARDRPRRQPRDRRRGHGLRLVSRFAGVHGGSFDLRREGDGTVAEMRLPLSREMGPR
ncbi:MAG TPA: ATP-binding protein [Solirubrobacterales bacterium]|nr:ATP-binding protein [Solirubrobacterales bacterium]